MNFLENVDILGFFIAVVTLIVTSWQQRKSVQNQALESSIRATLSDFTDLRRVHQERFDKAFSGATLQNKKEYVADLERFAVGVNQGAYHLQTLNRMSGGRLIKQWKSWVRDFISERRLNCSLYAMTPPDRFWALQFLNALISPIITNPLRCVCNQTAPSLPHNFTNEPLKSTNL